MDELQKARADWLDALRRNVELECEVERLKQANFELQSRLIASQTMAMVHECTANALVQAMFHV